MNEREIRRALARAREELDLLVRRGLRQVVLPATLGAGLALTGACSDDTESAADTTVVEAGVDLAVDVGVDAAPQEAGADLAEEAGGDLVAQEAGGDSAQEAGSDSAQEAGSDAIVSFEGGALYMAPDVAPLHTRV